MKFHTKDLYKVCFIYKVFSLQKVFFTVSMFFLQGVFHLQVCFCFRGFSLRFQWVFTGGVLFQVGFI